MQPNYLYYPKILQQGANNNFGSDLNDQRRIKPELFYLPYSNNSDEKTCSYKFLKAFSYLPCLPSSWSQSTRGAIGFGIFLFFASAVVVALGLIPVYITLGSNNDKNEFSIDVSNGLKIQNQNLQGILSQTNEANRTLDQNITLTNEINNLMTQLSARFRSLDPNLEKIYNIRLNPSSGQDIILSYSIKTNAITKSEMSSLQKKLESIINDQASFNELTLANSTVSINSNSNDIKLSDPVVGEFQSKNTILLSNSKSSLKSDSLSKFVEINDKKHNPISEEQKLIQSYSKIKFIKDDDYYIKKYPIYFPNYEHNYSPNEYHAYPEQYTEPYYPQEYNQYAEPKYQPEYTEKYEKKTDKYSKESYGHKKAEDKKKYKSKLKEEKPVLKKETENLNSNKTVVQLKETQANNVDVNDSDQSFQDSVEETTKKQIKENDEQKIKKINQIDTDKPQEDSKINNKEKKNEIDDSNKKLKNVDNLQEEPILSTKEIKISEKQKID